MYVSRAEATTIRRCCQASSGWTAEQLIFPREDTLVDELKSVNLAFTEPPLPCFSEISRLSRNNSVSSFKSVHLRVFNVAESSLP